jgi:hypothetical protein
MVAGENPFSTTRSNQVGGIIARGNTSVKGQRWEGSLVVLLLAERARSEGARPMRAAKGSLAAPLSACGENRKALVWLLVRLGVSVAACEY